MNNTPMTTADHNEIFQMNSGIRVSSSLITLLLMVLASASFAADEDINNWPREIETKRGLIVIYQPQPESLEGNLLRFRTALSVELEGKAPVFGAVWFEARLETDRAERTALITDLTVTDARFPNASADQIKSLSDFLESEIPDWNLPIEMDELVASLDLVELQAEESANIRVDPPIMLFMTEPAILITLDGKARYIATEEEAVERVMNTPFTLLRDKNSKIHYLYADKDSWYTAADIKGDWQIASAIPGSIAKLAPAEDPDAGGSAADDDEESPEIGPAPKIIIATEPTELISTTGKPEYATFENTDLLYVTNTDSDVLMDTVTQEHYVLLSGRWYASQSLEGPWRNIPVQELPEDFKKIPEESELGTVLYAVPGTEVAREAVLDAQVPQTAAIEKSKASLEVEYDGEPKFEPIEDTQMQWAVNTPTPVVRVKQGQYYAIDEAVWFYANKATGPWLLAASVPDEIYTIPSNSPIYNVTFVRIYGETDEVVYVGYTPGYTNTYVYNTTIVYGSGYYWPGWYGSYYYPRYSTWGFHVRWNPWTGWRFGFSYSYGPFTFVIGGGRWYRGGWFGPGRYRGYRHGYRHGYRRGARAGYRAGYRAGQRNNMYNSSRNRTRATTTTSASRNNARSSSLSNRAQAAGGNQRANNVYADKSGNIHRQTDQGWQQKTSDGWQSSGRTSDRQQQAGQQRSQQAQPSTSQPSSQQQSQQRTQQQSQRSSSYDLNQSSRARQQGSQRASSYRSSAGGAGRGGGRRR
jgi:hypothetical protein